MFQSNIIPGQGFVPLTVYRKTGEVTASGRAVEGGYIRTNVQFYGMIVNASQKEVDQWKQNGHPITHKIIQYGGGEAAKATDYISAPGMADFYVQGVKPPVNMKITNIYYVEENSDLKKELV